ncbi:hypothetical protein Esi_0240_0015 [Ectocarpus siliculosus]|uniref:Uncharacterized protein n=1 Tax=Ectocarpus siliculosus TaxID=2880 RepID=D7FSU5_ECTSI|nr:hypothetical protein Esi_0240_0015 [Ectocarpus siliculosus]|eukprot:CBJ31236.1 hypothetical protein Esi_0240_0015 [Ectocarpus siliculosus]
MPTHVWPREGEQPCRQDEAAIDAAIDDFLSEAHAAAPIFAGMVVEIMPETSSAPPDIRKRWWGLVGTNNKAVTRQGGGGAGTGDHGDRVMLGAPRTGTRAIPVERSRVAEVHRVPREGPGRMGCGGQQRRRPTTAASAQAGAPRSLRRLGPRPPSCKPRKRSRRLGGCGPPVRRARRSSLRRSCCRWTPSKRTINLPKGKKFPHLEDLRRRCNGIPR